jgi:hypothetical protein
MAYKVTENMEVEVVTKKGYFKFKNLQTAKLKFPTLDPEKNTKDFTWAMRGTKGMRFEDWPTYEMMSN